MTRPPRRPLGDDGGTRPDRLDEAGRDDHGGPPRPYVPRRDTGRARPAGGSRTPPPPFSGRDPTDADDAWQLVRVRGEHADDHRRRPGHRATARRWQAIEIGFEEWGRGALVIVGVPRRPTRGAAESTTLDEPVIADRARREAAGAGSDAMSQSEAGAPARPADDVEAVAVALETMALRVRVGEFRVRGLVPGMSDAAILAATLASILAPRR